MTLLSVTLCITLTIPNHPKPPIFLYLGSSDVFLIFATGDTIRNEIFIVCSKADKVILIYCTVPWTENNSKKTEKNRNEKFQKYGKQAENHRVRLEEREKSLRREWFVIRGEDRDFKFDRKGDCSKSWWILWQIAAKRNVIMVTHGSAVGIPDAGVTAQQPSVKTCSHAIISSSQLNSCH